MKHLSCVGSRKLHADLGLSEFSGGGLNADIEVTSPDVGLVFGCGYFALARKMTARSPAWSGSMSASPKHPWAKNYLAWPNPPWRLVSLFSLSWPKLNCIFRYFTRWLKLLIGRSCACPNRVNTRCFVVPFLAECGDRPTECLLDLTVH